MTELPPFVRLGHLENQMLLNKISRTDYIHEKVNLLREYQRQKITVKPIFKTRRQRVITNKIGMKFCYVPAGICIYGEENKIIENSAPYYLGKYPVTVAEFQQFLDETNWDYPESDREIMRRISPHPDCPATNISWLDAKQFCRWMRKKTGKYYSLPSEWEWEMAARGIDGRPYPWGYQEPTTDIACFHGKDRQYSTTVPVSTFVKNESSFGCIGMIGNVWEWCVDAFEDPRDVHVVRGGAWNSTSEYLNVTSRTIGFPSSNRIDSAGFRLIFLNQEMYKEYRLQVQANQGIQSGEKTGSVKTKEEKKPAKKIKSKKQLKIIRRI